MCQNVVLCVNGLIIVKTIGSGDRGMNPVIMTIISLWKEYWP